MYGSFPSKINSEEDGKKVDPNESSTTLTSFLDDSITFSSRIDFEETLKQIKEQDRKVNTHMNHYSKYLLPSPKPSSNQGNVESKPSYSSQIDALIRDFRKEVNHVSNSIPETPQVSTIKSNKDLKDEQEFEEIQDFQSPSFSMYSTSPQVENNRSNRLSTEPLFPQTNTTRRQDSSFNDSLTNGVKQVRPISHTNILDTNNYMKIDKDPMASPIINKVNSSLNNRTTSPRLSRSPVKEQERIRASPKKNVEISLRLENIQLKEEISKLQSSVVFLQSRMEGLERNMSQLFELVLKKQE
ncbi:hypothetical protein ABK040_001850 [Willaertia magna]